MTFEPGEQSDSYWCICPHCGLQTGDTWEWLESHNACNPLEETCERCKKKFRAWAEHEVTYCTEPIEDEPASRALQERGGRHE